MATHNPKNEKFFRLLSYPDPLIRKKNAAVDVRDPELPTIIAKMYETMHEADGVGLAAPQFGMNIRLAVVHYRGESVTLINPEITYYSRSTNVVEEGCLNMPGRYVPVRRSKKIHYKNTDIDGKVKKYKASGMIARIIQHETDHLNQTVILDRTDER